MRRSSISILLLGIVLSLTVSCHLVAPKTTALKNVHETYRQEFVEGINATPDSDRPVAEAASNEPEFSQTLQAIRGYRAKFGSDSKQAAHLTVLEGMIYLQSSRFGMAASVKGDVQAASENLRSKDGPYTRDALYAANFASLIDGWQEIDRMPEGALTQEDFATLEGAADAIVANLKEKEEEGKLASPDADEGAIYLATTSAIFYVWVHKIRTDSCLRIDEEATRECLAEFGKTYFDNGRDIIGMFLSETERTAALASDSAPSDFPPGRLRYLAWYRFLDEKADED